MDAFTGFVTFYVDLDTTELEFLEDYTDITGYLLKDTSSGDSHACSERP